MSSLCPFGDINPGAVWTNWFVENLTSPRPIKKADVQIHEVFAQGSQLGQKLSQILPLDHSPGLNPRCMPAPGRAGCPGALVPVITIGSDFLPGHSSHLVAWSGPLPAPSSLSPPSICRCSGFRGHTGPHTGPGIPFPPGSPYFFHKPQHRHLLVELRGKQRAESAVRQAHFISLHPTN